MLTQIAGQFLHDAHQNALWLQDGRHPHSLHDFRVALRRLRCWLKVGKKHWGLQLPSALAKNLKKLARSTNAARDIEVQCDLIKDYTAHQPQTKWLLKEWHAKRNDSRTSIKAAIHEQFPPLEKRIGEILEQERGNQIDIDAIQPVFELYANQLRQELQLVTSPNDHDQIHRARIAAKRLRYIVEPLVGKMPRFASVLATLKATQDVLGELHDLHVLLLDIDVDTQPRDTQAKKAIDELKRSLITRAQMVFSSNTELLNYRIDDERN